MIEALRTIGKDLKTYNLTTFAPIEELQKAIDSISKKDSGKHLGLAFRDLLERYGVDFNYPILLRPMGRMFKESLQRRAAVMIASDPLGAKVLVIETDSRYRDVTPDGKPSHDANFADISVYPIGLTRNKASSKPWYVDASTVPSPDTSRFWINIKRYGNTDLANTYNSGPGYRFPAWNTVDNSFAIDLLKEWSGLK